MLDKPNLAEAAIAAALQAHYGIAVRSLEFLPIGNDARAWVYRVESDERPYFLKLRRGAPKRSALYAPHYLQSQGIASAAAPTAARSNQLYAPLDGFSLILYPWIEGRSAWGMRLSSRQWAEWGGIMRSIHQTTITNELAELLPRETFGKAWTATLDRIHHLAAGDVQDEIARAMAQVWQSKAAQIEEARQRYLALGERLGAASPDLALCHADIHKANIMIDESDAIHIVDWDEAVIAPKERDLMFFVADGHAPEAVDAFLRGYGESKVDPIGIAYYRYDWALQEFCDNGERVFISETLTDRERRFALNEFKRLFVKGDVIDRARQAYCQAQRRSS